MKVLFVIIVLLLLAVGLVWFMILMTKRRMLRAGAKRAVEKAWQKVKTHTSPTLKLVEADKILDEALRLLGYAGTLGEKLQKAGPRFSDINGVWWAHKLRNRVVHDLTSQASDGETNRAISIYHKALTDLGARL